MTRVRISLAAAHNQGLPPICMCCGAPAALYKRQQFVWVSRWALLTGLLGSWSSWRATMQGPLCSAHRYHWTWRWVLPLCLFPLPVAAAAATYISLDIALGKEVAREWAGWIYGLGFGGFFLWLVFFQILRHTGVHPIRIDKDSITFTGVADAFAEALENPVAPAEPVRAAAAKRAVMPEVLLVDDEVLDMQVVDDEVLDMQVVDDDRPDITRPQEPGCA